ncbi:MAG: phosphorylase [Candidatus Thiodiazotropha sp. (ex Codakia rugifera)]|nr:phosphorylase [Candidatus Thiodiazotropha sp. (ex Codakia rugifera)]
MTTRFKAGNLWAEIVARTQSSIANGTLHSIETDFHSVRQNNYSFIVRVATNLERKVQETKRLDSNQQQDEPFNPFLKPEPELTVADISQTHLSVLNKFNVVEHHLLIITREFEHQERLLSLQDFEALWYCLSEYPSLGFYNGGTAAGASQHHKHLQLVPLPLYPGQVLYPLEKLYSTLTKKMTLQSLKQLPFVHSWRPLPLGIENRPSEAAKQTLAIYQQMLASVGISRWGRQDGEYQSAPYNLLVTREWMLLVPRSQEQYKGISVNALGYVGSLFVKDRNGLETVRKYGPMNLLKTVSMEINSVDR